MICKGCRAYMPLPWPAGSSSHFLPLKLKRQRSWTGGTGLRPGKGCEHRGRAVAALLPAYRFTAALLPNDRYG